MKSFEKTLDSNKQAILQYVFSLCLITIAAQVTIPLQPVPISLLTLAILFVGLTNSVRQSAYAVGTYLTLGAIGFPIFANFTAGLPILVGPTGGYLIGSFAAATSVAWLQEKRQAKNILDYALYTLTGTCIIYIFGITWLSHFIGLEKALQFGLLPFILPGIVKCALLSGLLKLTKNKTKK